MPAARLLRTTRMGTTPSGVRAVEPVTLLFPNAFPLQAPVALLRKDFDRSLAHVQPGTIADRPVPCLFDGSLTELLQSGGILGVVDQLAEWLNRAALGTLINPHHGWEPVRRDTVDDRIVCDADWIRAQVGKKARGFLVMPFSYHRLTGENPSDVFFYGTIATEVGRWPRVETGGILIGRYSEASRQFQVVDLLPAPEDSTRSAAEFVLGKKGVRRALKDFRSRYRDSLYCLGTWHSHLHDSGPSRTDVLTAAAIAVSQVPPTLSLIRTPNNFRALVAFRTGQA